MAVTSASAPPGANLVGACAQRIAESRSMRAFKSFQFPTVSRVTAYPSYHTCAFWSCFLFGGVFFKWPWSATECVNRHTLHSHRANHGWERQLRPTAQRARGHAADDHSSFATDFHDLRRLQALCLFCGCIWALWKTGRVLAEKLTYHEKDIYLSLSLYIYIYIIISNEMPSS